MTDVPYPSFYPQGLQCEARLVIGQLTEVGSDVSTPRLEVVKPPLCLSPTLALAAEQVLLNFKLTHLLNKRRKFSVHEGG